MKSTGGAKDAFEREVHPYLTPLFRTAYRLAGTRTDAEDLVQEVLIRLYREFSRWLTMDQRQGWLIRVLYNLHIDNCRKKARTLGVDEKTLDADDTRLDRLASPEATPAEELDADRRQRRILAALWSLQPDHRALAVLHLMEGYAGAGGHAVGTLKSRLHRCKAQLKKQLAMEPFL